MVIKGGEKMLRKREHSDGFTGIGTVTIHPFKILSDGTKQYLPFTKNNLIVEAGRASLIDLLTGARRKKLAYIRWGKGGALNFPEGDPLNPLAVDDKDTDIATFLLDKPLSPYNRTSPTEVEYVETLICDEVNDDVNEAVMLFEDETSQERTIFARITFPTVRLTLEQGTGIEIRWVFNFSKAEEIEVSYQEPSIPTPPDSSDVTPPANVTGLSKTVTGNSVTISWANPLDEDFSHVTIFRDGNQVATNVTAASYTETVTVTGLHTYRVVSVDLAGNESAGASIDVTI